MDLEKLVAQGEKALEEFQPELALKFFKRALAIDNQESSTTARVLDLTGETLVAVGEPEEALGHFLKSSQVAPNENPYKWLYLGQLQEGSESLQCFRTGIAMLGALKQEQTDAAACEKLDKEIGKAYCNIAEIYMTDLCMEENAEQQCEEAVRLATEHDSTSLDLGLSLANLRLSQSRPEDACSAMAVVYKHVIASLDAQARKPILSAFREDQSADSAASSSAEEPEPVEPEMCVSVVQRLIECATVQPALATAAMEVAQRLLLLDDSNIELWYLLGVAAMSCQPPEADTAAEVLGRAKEMLEGLAKQAGGGAQKMPQELQCQYELVCENLVAAQAVPRTDATDAVPMEDDDDEDDEDDAEYEAAP